MRNLIIGLQALLLVGCLPKRQLEGDVLTYTFLPTSPPSVAFAEGLCPGEEAPDEPPTGRMFVMEDGHTLVSWSGGDMLYMSTHTNH
jgi:hypothetical protein